jgi:hypothetical protein
MGFGAERAVPDVGSMMALDERGVALRATWRLNHGFINLSNWRDDRCIETFHLTPTDAAAFVSFLVSGLAEVASVTPAAPVLRAVDGGAPVASTGRRPLHHDVRTRAADLLRRAADRVAP